MKIMILSDSHAMSKSDLLKLLKANPVDYYIHCGDIFIGYDNLPLNNFYLVRGNNDYGNIPNEICPSFDNLKFFVTHGHLYDVDYNMDYLYQSAKEKKADVICYGHTHRPYYDEIDGTIIINPGSVSYPRGQYRFPTYCIFDTKEKKATFYQVKTLEPCDPFTSNQSNKRKKEPFFKKWFK